jgi:hypothetical protein
MNDRPTGKFIGIVFEGIDIYKVAVCQNTRGRLSICGHQQMNSETIKTTFLAGLMASILFFTIYLGSSVKWQLG